MLYRLMWGRENDELSIFLFEVVLFFSGFFNYSLMFPNCFNGPPFPFDSLPLQADAFIRRSFSFDEACQPCTDAHPSGEHQPEAKKLVRWSSLPKGGTKCKGGA